MGVQKVKTTINKKTYMSSKVNLIKKKSDFLKEIKKDIKWRRPSLKRVYIKKKKTILS